MAMISAERARSFCQLSLTYALRVCADPERAGQPADYEGCSMLMRELFVVSVSKAVM